jgi:hypothetical protein
MLFLIFEDKNVEREDSALPELGPPLRCWTARFEDLDY